MKGEMYEGKNEKIVKKCGRRSEEKGGMSKKVREKKKGSNREK